MRAAAPASALAVLVGCGAVQERESRPRPPAAITVTAAVTEGRVLVSPRRFGAGPVVVLISNQTDRRQALTFVTADDRPGVTRTSRPIAPAATGSLELDVPPGRHELRAKGITPATVRVGARRASAQDSLLTP